MKLRHSDPSPLTGTMVLDDSARDVLKEVYKEVCTSFHAIDEFRAKLLGILPIASLAGMLAIAKELTADPTGRRLIGFAGFFAAAFTLALFLFEIRGILRCHFLIERGAQIEKALGVRGQFCVCSQQFEKTAESRADSVFNVKVAASTIYSLVFSAWIFLALRFTFDFHIIGCGLTATIVGGILAVGVYRVVTEAIPA